MLWPHIQKICEGLLELLSIHIDNIFEMCSSCRPDHHEENIFNVFQNFACSKMWSAL
jgi:hypothetical protein